MGCSVNCYALAWVLGQALKTYLGREIKIEDLWLHAPILIQDGADREWQEECMRQFCRRATHRGSDVRLATGRLMRPNLWPRQSIDPSWWKWKVIISYPLFGRHINVHELHALLQSYRWRTRSAYEIKKRSLHAVDSQVVLSVAVKGRSSSHQLNHLLKRLNALVLAASLQLHLVYIRTDLNSADRPSRWRHDG